MEDLKNLIFFNCGNNHEIALMEAKSLGGIEKFNFSKDLKPKICIIIQKIN